MLNACTKHDDCVVVFTGKTTCPVCQKLSTLLGQGEGEPPTINPAPPKPTPHK